MFFKAALFNVHVHATHILGVENTAADALSRNCLSNFLQVVPDVDRLPTAIPQALVDLPVMEQPDWKSPRWVQLFSVLCKQV